ncbi:MAG: FGGY family carbohydrate kinase [Acidimicrobiales bacterium]
MTALVLDVGTTGVRAGTVDDSGALALRAKRVVRPSSPLPGFVEVDAVALAGAALEVASEAIEAVGRVDAVGVTNQRATTIVWDRRSGEPVGPGIGWQDLRTVGSCLLLQGQGIRLAPNQSATKLAALLEVADPQRRRDLCFGTVDTWLAWTLSGGSLHVTDPSNAGVTGLLLADASGWDMDVAGALRIPPSALPGIVGSSEVVGHATRLAGHPPIAALVGDQQASLVGQGCTRRGLAKATFGTGGMLDLCTGEQRPRSSGRGPAGTYPVVAWRRSGRTAWGLEAIMLSAGSALDWLADDLGLLSDPAESDTLAAACPDSGDVVFVPALLGLGTPDWDFGARGLLLGLTGGTGRPEIARAVLEGIAHRGADLVEAAESDSGLRIEALRVDGGMSANRTFVQALADATQRPVQVSPVLEATALGAAYLAGLAVGTWADEEELATLWAPGRVVEPRRLLDRDRWREGRERARGTVPELSALQF